MVAGQVLDPATLRVKLNCVAVCPIWAYFCRHTGVFIRGPHSPLVPFVFQEIFVCGLPGIGNGLSASELKWVYPQQSRDLSGIVAVFVVIVTSATRAVPKRVKQAIVMGSAERCSRIRCSLTYGGVCR